jgi:hypothetical protein
MIKSARGSFCKAIAMFFSPGKLAVEKVISSAILLKIAAKKNTPC